MRRRRLTLYDRPALRACIQDAATRAAPPTAKPTDQPSDEVPLSGVLVFDRDIDQPTAPLAPFDLTSAMRHWASSVCEAGDRNCKITRVRYVFPPKKRGHRSPTWWADPQEKRNTSSQLTCYWSVTEVVPGGSGMGIVVGWCCLPSGSMELTECTIVRTTGRVADSVSAGQRAGHALR